MKKCKTPNCNLEIKCRGICKNCYSKYQYWIAKKETTWSELEQLGLADAVQSPLPPIIKQAREAAKKKTKGGK